ncbi:MAG: hypothetical protein HOE92_01785 [Euryarchaeota archaeon]|jgi:cation transport ATPase|nr:hypothetical protein [Euryarchaeota archaeon]MBT6645867.1 hypothetical protein [Euryarchaeota archaeon]
MQHNEKLEDKNMSMSKEISNDEKRSMCKQKMPMMMVGLMLLIMVGMMLAMMTGSSFYSGMGSHNDNMMCMVMAMVITMFVVMYFFKSKHQGNSCCGKCVHNNVK